MTKGLISVVIPIYNAEKTIAKCIESVLCQTYQNFEILLINDGSPDNSEEVCLKYVEKDKRVRYIKKENGGVSTARNRGIDEAKGEYVTFIDSDDWIEPDSLENLYNAAKTYKAEIVSPRCRGVYFLDNGIFDKCVFDDDNFEKLVISDRLSEEFESLFKASLLCSVCGRLFSTAFLKSQNIKFSDELKVLEDFCFTINCLKCCSVFVHINKVVYNYVVVNVENYQFKRDYLCFINSTDRVSEVLFLFLNEKNIKITSDYYNFIMDYWILALQGVMKTEKSILDRYFAVRTIKRKVLSHDVWQRCSNAKYDTQFRMLFNHKSTILFLIIDKLKRIKIMLNRKFL